MVRLHKPPHMPSPIAPGIMAKKQSFGDIGTVRIWGMVHVQVNSLIGRMLVSKTNDLGSSPGWPADILLNNFILYTKTPYVFDILW